MRFLAIAVAMMLATKSQTIQSPKPELTADRTLQALAVSFTLHPENYDDLNVRLSHLKPTSVSWIVDLRRLRYPLERVWATATIRVTARPLNQETFSISRRVNGLVTESDILADRSGAQAWLTSFSDVRLFEQFKIESDVDYLLTIRATVEGGSESPIVTSTLARTRLRRVASMPDAPMTCLAFFGPPEA